MRRNFIGLAKAALCFLFAAANARPQDPKVYQADGLSLVLILDPRGCDARGVCQMVLPIQPLSAKTSCAIFQTSPPEELDRSAWNCLFSTFRGRLSSDSKVLVTACVRALEVAFNSSPTLKSRSVADKLKFIERMAKTIVLELVPKRDAAAMFPEKAVIIVKAERNTEGTDNYHILINPAFGLEVTKKFLAPAALELVAEISREMWPAPRFGAAS